MEEKGPRTKWSRKWRSGCRVGYPCRCWPPRKGEGAEVKEKIGARCPRVR